MSKILHKYITAIHYVEKTLLVLSGENNDASFSSFATVIGTPAEIASASISLVFLISNGIGKMFLKKIGTKKIKTKRLL